MVGPGDTVEVSASRAVELRQNGLIEEFEMKTEPENKKAPEPSNKSAQKPAAKPADKSKA